MNSYEGFINDFQRFADGQGESTENMESCSSEQLQGLDPFPQPTQFMPAVSGPINHRPLPTAQGAPFSLGPAMVTVQPSDDRRQPQPQQPPRKFKEPVICFPTPPRKDFDIKQLEQGMLFWDFSNPKAAQQGVLDFASSLLFRPENWASREIRLLGTEAGMWLWLKQAMRSYGYVYPFHLLPPFTDHITRYMFFDEVAAHPMAGWNAPVFYAACLDPAITLPSWLKDRFWVKAEPPYPEKGLNFPGWLLMLKAGSSRDQ